ncbi:MAG: ATP-binding cassette domain-containing protein [Erysipelotrichaceae bacterium]|nr:ATP-binding cassette domain-containing protein [Erysipelotrichaceae bacterium]
MQEEIKKINEELGAIVDKNRALIKDAKVDSKKVDQEYAKSLLKALEAEYAEKFEAAKLDDKKLAELKKEYKNRCKIAKKSKLVTQIQMIFQDPIASLDPRMTVRDIISEGLVIKGVTDKDYINEKVYEILDMVGLVPEHADRYPHEFSGGQRQRIGIARAVIMQPEMIIADEPISALDVSIQAQVINLLNDLRERLGLTILFIAHDLSVVKYFSDRIGVMYFGKMVELADSDELFKNPLHPYTKSLLSAIPLPDPVYEKQRVRIHYNPIAEHDYSVDTPSFREITPGHFVYCNDAEEKEYKQLIK